MESIWELYLEQVANFMRGMSIDPQIPIHARDALLYRSEQIFMLLKEEETDYRKESESTTKESKEPT